MVEPGCGNEPEILTVFDASVCFYRHKPFENRLLAAPLPYTHKEQSKQESTVWCSPIQNKCEVLIASSIKSTLNPKTED
ncbi:hypothetical protein KIN20_015446 [Parelaphostrongylus tenuis]|uniref:Uncharacterized protein n=1 Tax=Parelaphostrongylus tenuis TaxID=148309 RepID=A0AAD5N0M6_PARTN|nr:hypothetical protein KIN20_015446 [Parelaphostrongylus tenuis]